MIFDRTEPSKEEIKHWFLDPPDVPEGTFEFALVLGGTVSAGAYTAGAVDFLIEALDCLTAAQQQEQAPSHKVILKLIAGTSGGGVNAAIASRVLAYDYPHIVRSTPLDPQKSGNPFYDVWVNTLRLDRFLDPSDVSGQVKSALNGAPIDDGAAQIVSFASGTPKTRPWVAEPLRVILTLTSLRGVPYSTDLGGGLSQSYIDHADYGRFAFVYPGQQIREPRPDEQVLCFAGERLPQATGWEEFSQFARATAAFPLGFPARALTRPTNHYRWRVVPYPPGPQGADTYMVRRPDWAAMISPPATDVPQDWHFLCVDGGATDNEPIELARTALAGLLGRNPRDPAKANRAVWLIDPFAGRAALGPQGETTFLSDAGAVVSTLTQQTRYDSADILMATDPNVFSRFMLSPKRGNITGEDAIASGGVGAFVGFACPAFMRFDYLLGRANCQEFLRTQFNLADTNPLFKDWKSPQFTNWTNQQRAALRPYTPSGQGRLPIIPLVGDAAIPEALDPWPKGKLNPERYRDAIETRFRKIFELELSGDLAKSALGWLGAHATQKYVADYLIDAMRAYLEKADLA
jgi:Patatin-like phospholipase